MGVAVGVKSGRGPRSPAWTARLANPRSVTSGVPALVWGDVKTGLLTWLTAFATGRESRIRPVGRQRYTDARWRVGISQMPDATENQFLGALLGMAIGDALGAPVSGMNRAEIGAQFGTIDRFQGRTQAGAEEIHPGEFTDETEVALCIVESMTANRGNLDAETAGVRMLHLAAGPSRRWMQPATVAALDAAADTLEFSVPLDEDGPATGDVAARGVPVGLVHSVGRFDPAQMRADAEAVVRLTHGGPAAFNAATAIAYAVYLAATGVPRESWARETAEFLGGGELAERLTELDHRLANSALPDLFEWTGTGLDALESVPAAFTAAMTEPVFEHAVFAAVNAGDRK